MEPGIVLALASNLSEIRGKKIFQKLCYFLQEAEGQRLGARFRMKHYGPYSEDLEDLLEDLDERRVLSVSGSSDEGFRISCGSNFPQDLQMEPGVEDAVHKLLDGLGSSVNQGLTLEVLATAHFLAQELPYRGTESDKIALIAKVRAWKGSKFNADFIRKSIERLEELGYLKAA
jgi:hypothetical protein